MAIHLLGIRHYGPGSCRNVLNYLQEPQPDLTLVEGLAEAEALLTHVENLQMTPPVALLAYQPDEPRNVVLYPFVEFSPKWQVMLYAVQNRVSFRFFDLPLIYSLALRAEETSEQETGTTAEVAEAGGPFNWLAHAAGFTDGESWWKTMIEHRQEPADILQVVQEAVTALREELPGHISPRDLIREVWMRKMIRSAQKKNFERIVVVCGVWHVPALDDMPKVKDDNKPLKGPPKVKVECTWIPWIYDRPIFHSGYGAGIESPGWYHYLWYHPEDDGTLWGSRIASLLRQKNMDISVAHVIETVRLAQITTALRDLPYPSLNKYNETVIMVMGFGNDILLQITKREPIASNRLGSVPDDVPKVLLLVDVEKIQKRLRVPFTAEIKELILDLRKPNDLERSTFFHRLQLLGIDWTILGRIDGKGTLEEKWTSYHKPE